MKLYRSILLILILIPLLLGCTPKDNIKMPDLLLKDDVKSQISEEFAVDFMTYVSGSVKIYNSYLKDFENNINENSIEKIATKSIIEKWSEEDLSGLENEMFKKIVKSNDNIKLFNALYEYKSKEDYEDYLEGVKEVNEISFKSLFEYFEND